MKFIVETEKDISPNRLNEIIYFGMVNLDTDLGFVIVEKLEGVRKKGKFSRKAKR